jgi:hypothetical protein
VSVGNRSLNDYELENELKALAIKTTMSNYAFQEMPQYRMVERKSDGSIVLHRLSLSQITLIWNPESRTKVLLKGTDENLNQKNDQKPSILSYSIQKQIAESS